MIKILNNLFFAFLADILGYCFVFAKMKSFDLKIFVVSFFFTFLFLTFLILLIIFMLKDLRIRMVMIMSKVLPDYGYLIGLNGEIVPGDEESEYIKRYLPVLLLYDAVRLGVKFYYSLLDSSDNDNKNKEPVETQQD